MSDLADRIDALRSRNDGLTDEDAKEAFLEALAQGILPHEASRKAERTLTWFRHRRQPKSRHYDVDFHMRYDEIMDPEGDFRHALIEQARSWLAQAASDGNVRAIEKILMAYDPDFTFLRPAAIQGGLNVEQLQVFFGELPLEKLMELKEAREKARMKELAVIDQ